MNWIEMGRFLIIIGVVVAVIGILFLFSDKLPLGKLPGDIKLSKSNFQLYIPVTTCILLSVIITLIVNFFSKK